MKRIIAILTGLLGIFVGAGFILPALAKLRGHGAMQDGDVALYTLGFVLVLGGLGIALCGLVRRVASGRDARTA